MLAPDQRKVLGSNPSAPKFVLRDGVTGNTPGFELENEGSTPSPAANQFATEGTSIRGGDEHGKQDTIQVANRQAGSRY